MPGAVKTDLSPNQGEELIARHGRDREFLLEKARPIKAES